MCLLLLAVGALEGVPLVVAANRDEFLARPTAPADFWPERPEVLAGRDLAAGGTWLGVTTSGRFAALTNYRDPAAHRGTAASRGGLVSGFLASVDVAEDHLAAVARDAERYNPFNMVAGDASALFWLSSRTGRVEQVGRGVHGLSNHLLDTPWPKVARGRERLAALLARGVPEPEDLFRLLTDAERFPDHELPQTGVGLQWERVLSSAFIEAAGYGTRSSTVLLVRSSGEVDFVERTHGPEGAERRFRFHAKAIHEVNR
jgi:uncharacterized protein with NRDE domain